MSGDEQTTDILYNRRSYHNVGEAQVARGAKHNNTAAPQVAGYILQLERALCHLAGAAADVSVGVEHVDDVVQIRGGAVVLKEQDKNSVMPDAELLGDRSKALWRTLQIWLTQEDTSGVPCERLLLVTNTPVGTGIATLLKGVVAGSCKPKTVVEALRAAGGLRSKAKVQKIIDNVLDHDDATLIRLVSRIEIVDRFDVDDARLKIASGLAFHPDMDAEITLDGLLGWLTRTLREAWHAQQPGIISRLSCIRQCREIEGRQARLRFLPRPARDVAVQAVDRTRARARPFVEHLGRIDAEEEDIFQAVEHFVQFNMEKHRLAVEGEIADREWRDRSDRLRQRWKNIFRSIQREQGSCTPQQLGHRVLVQSTYQHLEPLGGHSCSELYMTSGHYHRLADDDEVWWDPTYFSGAIR